jgi:hypothetical protein
MIVTSLGSKNCRRRNGKQKNRKRKAKNRPPLQSKKRLLSVKTERGVAGRMYQKEREKKEMIRK